MHPRAKVNQGKVYLDGNFRNTAFFLLIFFFFFLYEIHEANEKNSSFLWAAKEREDGRKKTFDLAEIRDIFVPRSIRVRRKEKQHTTTLSITFAHIWPLWKYAESLSRFSHTYYCHHSQLCNYIDISEFTVSCALAVDRVSLYRNNYNNSKTNSMCSGNLINIDLNVTRRCHSQRLR